MITFYVRGPENTALAHDGMFHPDIPDTVRLEFTSPEEAVKWIVSTMKHPSFFCVGVVRCTSFFKGR